MQPGDRVRLKLTSSFYKQPSIKTGIVVSPRHTMNTAEWIAVEFDDGYYNHYPIKDVEPLRIIEVVREKTYMNLYQYQQHGVHLIDEWRGRVLLADEQGLGKTAQTLCWTARHPQLKPVVVVCQATLKLVWKNELQKWVPDQQSRDNRRH